ncbi:MAG: glycosyltransferase family 2 protein [Magnetococcus sp. YQC-5]
MKTMRCQEEGERWNQEQKSQQPEPSEECIISLVIPAYNEEPNIPLIYELCQPILAGMGTYEILFVDDGSNDGTLESIKRLVQKDPCVKYLVLSRNFGHQTALRVGMDHAKGMCVISMDADMQQPAALMVTMVERWRAGFDVVVTSRQVSPNLPVIKKVTARLYYWLINLLSDLPVIPGGADFRLLDQGVVRALRQLSEREMFYRGVIPWLGYRSCVLPYEAKVRTHGKTKYSLHKMLKLGLTGILSTSIRPMHFALYVAATIFTMLVCFALYALLVYVFTGEAIITGVLSTIMLQGGVWTVHLTILGIMGEYLGRVLREVLGRPPYLVREDNINLVPRPERPTALEKRHAALPMKWTVQEGNDKPLV